MEGSKRPGRLLCLIVTAGLLVWPAGWRSPAEAGQWIRDPQSNCHVWNHFPMPNEAVHWTGGCRNGKAHGRGQLHWSVGGRHNGTYEGMYADGVRHGRGTFHHANGNRHTGQYRDDLANGHGEFVYANGNRYEGEFKNGAFHGKGAFHFANGDRYVGEFVNNVFHGHGTFTRRDGYSVTGLFRSGRYVPDEGDPVRPAGQQ